MILRNTRTLEAFVIKGLSKDVKKYHNVETLNALGITIPCNELDKFVIEPVSEFDSKRNYPVVEVL
ncbi:hypothetical protein [Vibrio bivalvicida]|uniref:Uncharacterized protein n=1 Tax=Vibrio bivalvicida TaxID=1276888 RepID=A0A177XV03_9VIBR|nr:hypothetical protein [Vibrio bivalvicida]OAJ92434.1 hypothetical protein APB76_20790 [Vibrio bivalvicida]